MDVVSQNPGQRWDLPYSEVGSLPLNNLEDLHRYTGQWDLGSLSNSTYHSVYHPLYEIEGFVETVARTHPHLVQLVNLGHSAEGREMTAMRISRSDDGLRKASRKEKVGFVLTGAQHAREVSTPDRARRRAALTFTCFTRVVDSDVNGAVPHTCPACR